MRLQKFNKRTSKGNMNFFRTLKGVETRRLVGELCFFFFFFLVYTARLCAYFLSGSFNKNEGKKFWKLKMRRQSFANLILAF